MQITVELKDQYGTQVVYPVCERARLFAKLAGTRTLTHNALEIIKALGYEVNVKQPELSI
jgi:hypothetical protein